MTDSTGRVIANLPAPAKLNLFLHIVGRRDDGYHLLESVFTLISLHDTITLSARDDGSIARSGDLADSAEDLCVRAAMLLRREAGAKAGAGIDVKKRIPAGAGMGGGSSDAATTLIGLNRLWGLRFSRDDLEQMGQELGADVPFFIRGRNAFVEGIGEVITPIDIPETDFAVIWPGVFSSTAKAFKSPNLTRNTLSLTITDLRGALERGEILGTFGHNDLEGPIFEELSEAREAAAHLAAFGPARMTGSGSAVFSPFGSASGAAAALSGIPEKWKGFVVRSLAEHPLLGWLDSRRR